MKVISFTVFKCVALTVFVCLHSIEVQSHVPAFKVPHPTIEAFQPMGLRISIPDTPGIQLFAFHGAINRPMNGIEAGDISKDMVKKQNGRWVIEDKIVNLNLGDTLNYWLFVIRNNLGYRLDNQSFVVTERLDAPPGFTNTNSKKHKTKPTCAGEEVSTYSPPPQCVCPQKPIEIDPPICKYEENHPSTTQQPLRSTTPSALSENLNILRELYQNASKENEFLRSQLVETQEDKTYVVNKLRNIGDTNLYKLILSGPTQNTDSLTTQVESVLREKLGIDNYHIVRSAENYENGTIIFELNTFEDKLNVLRKAKEKLTMSRFKIEDVQSAIIDHK